jgi:hypothetical protein
MFRLLVLCVVVVALGVAFAPNFRVALSWVLAFLSLLMLGDLVVSSLAKRRRPGTRSASPRA